MEVIWEGILAGYGIAIPVGAIAILIVDTGLRRGLLTGLMAGGGAATADFIYAGVAVVAGSVLAPALAPYETAIRASSAFVLLAIGGYGLWRSLRPGNATDTVDVGQRQNNRLRIYFQFLGLTLLNPMTVAYFSALVLGSHKLYSLDASKRLLFTVSAGLASLSWQSLLALVGASARQRLGPRFQTVASLIGNLVVIALGGRILWLWLQ